MALSKNSSSDKGSSSGSTDKKSFWTAGRAVLTLVALGLAGALGLSSCNSTEVATTNAPANRAANVSRPTNPAPPVAPVNLPPEVRDLKLQTIDGEPLKLSDFGDKVVVLNIWATWCGPCRLEMPDLVKLNHEYKERGLVVLGLTREDERNNLQQVKDFVRAQKVDYKIIWDDGSLAGPLVEAVGGRPVIPQSFVISRDGRIVKHFSGFNRYETPQRMREAVEAALNDKGKA